MKSIAIFELALGTAMLYYATRYKGTERVILGITGGYLYFGAYMNFTHRVKIVNK